MIKAAGAFRLSRPHCTTEEAAMAKFDPKNQRFAGVSGRLAVPEHDEITRKLAMLIEGECDGLGPIEAAKKFGFSKQRYFQLRNAYNEYGATALVSRKRGPKTHYRRTAEVVRQVLRHRFLDPEATAEVIAQKLRQSGWAISIRSVQRVIAEYGVQKKTLSVPTEGESSTGNPTDRQSHTARAVRPRQSRTRRSPTPGG
jgi:transposase